MPQYKRLPLISYKHSEGTVEEIQSRIADAHAWFGGYLGAALRDLPEKEATKLRVAYEDSLKNHDLVMFTPAD